MFYVALSLVNSIAIEKLKYSDRIDGILSTE